MARHTLEIHGAELGYRDIRVMDDLSVTIPEGQITTLIGPNGSGKSTILHALARILKPRRGSVLLDGRNIHDHPTREVAKVLALLPQAPHAPDGLSVWELVSFGRFPYRGWFDADAPDDRQVVEEALDAVGLEDLATRPVATLSGGQRQRVWIAMALAQQTGLILLDEPTTYLDPGHQIEILDLLRRLNRREGKTIVMALHDLNLAARYADFMVVVFNGGVLAADAPERVLTSDVLRNAFGLDAEIIPDPRRGTPMCVVYSDRAVSPDNPEDKESVRRSRSCCCDSPSTGS